MQQQIKAENILHRLCRGKRLLEVKDNPFYHHLIEEMKKEITSLREILHEGREVRAQCGQLLLETALLVDQHLSFHDKCQVIGISHIAAFRALDGDTTTSFKEMVFCHVLEYRGREDSYPLLDISTPFYSATSEYMKTSHNQMKTESLAKSLPY
jgi:hypothetical protein